MVVKLTCTQILIYYHFLSFWSMVWGLWVVGSGQIFTMPRRLVHTYFTYASDSPTPTFRPSDNLTRAHFDPVTFVP